MEIAINKKNSIQDWFSINESTGISFLKLKYYCEVKDGTHETPGYVEPSDETFPLITSKDIKNGEISFDDAKYISEEDFLKINMRSNVKKNDVIMPMIGTIGNPAIVNTNRDFSIKNVALFKTKSIIEAKYLKYTLDNHIVHKQFELLNRGGVQSFVSLNLLENIYIIKNKSMELLVNFLDYKTNEIDSLISDKEKLITLLEEKRQAVITEAVTKGLNHDVEMKDSGVEWIGKVPQGWKMVRLKHIGEAITGLTYSPTEVVSEGEGKLVLRSSNIKDGQIVYGNNVFVNKEIPEKLISKAGDILICSRNGSRHLIGKCALIDVESEGSSFGAFTTTFRSRSNEFLYFVFQSQLFHSQIGSFLTSTINQLTIGNLKSFPIVLPDDKEQKKLVDFLNLKTSEINSLVKDVKETINKLKEYRQSVIYEAVTGKIDVCEYGKINE